MDKYDETRISLTICFIVFVILKLTNLISWSWWWVTIPLWGTALIATIVTIILIVTKDKM